MPTTPTIDPAPAAVPTSDKPRVVSLDLLRIIGAVAIVVIHVTDDGFSAMNDLPRAQWLYCLALDCAMRWAVPIFVMVSGFLLLNPSKKDETAVAFFRKRFRRIGIPVVAWSAIYIAWRTLFGHEHMSIETMLAQAATGMAAYHMWFVFMLAGLYLATPAIRVFTRHAPISLQRGTCVGLLALAAADSVMRAGNSDPTVFVQFIPFIGYYIAGVAFSGLKVSRATVTALCGAVLLGIVAMVVVAAHIARGSGDPENAQFVLDELSPAAIVLSLSVYILAQSTLSKFDGGRFAALITRHLAPATMGVYLVHPIVLDLLDSVGLGYDWHGVWLGVPTRVAAAVVASFIAGLILQRIPVVKSIVGA